MKNTEVSAKRERTDAPTARSFVERDYAREVAAYRSSERLMPLLLDAGASYPNHNHPGGEEVYVLEGEIRFGPTQLNAGD